MDEAIFKAGKWIDYSKSHPEVKKISQKGRVLGYVTAF